jgi:hypothetical protein
MSPRKPEPAGDLMAALRASLEAALAGRPTVAVPDPAGEAPTTAEAVADPDCPHGEPGCAFGSGACDCAT